VVCLNAANACRAGWIVAAVLCWGACHGQPGLEINSETSSSNLLPPDPNSSNPPATRSYDLAQHAKQYLRSTFGARALEVSLSSAITSTAFRNLSGLEYGSGNYPNRIAANLAGHTIAQSIEFGTSAFLRQEEGFSPSGEKGFRKRAAYALYRTFVMRGRAGDELAFPRFAAAAGTAWITHRWHPWQEAEPNVWSQAGCILARYALKSYWTEFRPEIIRATRKVFRRHDLIAPAATFPTPPPETESVSGSQDDAEETRH